MQIRQYTFANAEISLIVEALQRAAKRQESEAKWYDNRLNEKLSTEHEKKARAMQRLINKLQPMTGLHGAVKP
jgi:uncharacterized protein YlxW (UPF0749 family)